MLTGEVVPLKSMRRPVIIAVTVSLVAGLSGGACSLGSDGSEGTATQITTTTAGPVGSTVVASTTTTTEPPARPSAAGLCDVAILEPAGPITDGGLTEISGAVVSRDQTDVMWVHNDSGHPNEVWAIDPEGSVLGRFTVPGATSVDWEDIGLGAGPIADRSYLYVGDIGDNSFTPVIGTGLDPRSETKPAVIYRVPEPVVTADPGDDPGVETSADVTPEAGSPTGASTEVASGTEPAVAFPVAFADGPRDAEALLADPVSGDVFVIAKQWDRSATGLYRLPATVVGADSAPTGITTMERVADVAGPDGATGPGLITGADVSADGTLVVLRTYGSVILWDRDSDETLAETVVESPTCTRAVDEPQGEAVAFGSDSQSLVTISEGEGVPLDWLRVAKG